MDGTVRLPVRFCDIIFELNLTHLINQPTYIAGNILDLILRSSLDSIFNLHIHDNLPLPISSDHYIIKFAIVTSPAVPGKTKGPIHLLSLSFFECCGYFTLFWFEDIEFIWSYLNGLIKDAINKFVPTFPTSFNKEPIWFNSHIFNIILNV